MNDVQQKEAKIIYKQLLADIPMELTPALLRLVFHDAGAYIINKKKAGGMRGGIRFEAIFSHPSNLGLKSSVDFLKQFQNTLDNTEKIKVSFADLSVMAGVVSIKKCGGPTIPIQMGRKDAASIEEAGDQNLLPDSNMPYKDLVKRFAEMGFELKDLVALSGAHTLGKSEGKAFTNDPYTFNNSYFKRLLKETMNDDLTFLPTDRVLIQNKESRDYVENYATDQELFFKDFTKAYQKLSMLGVQ